MRTLIQRLAKLDDASWHSLRLNWGRCLLAATQAVTASWGASALLPVVALLTALTPAVPLMVYRREESMAPESDLPLVLRPTQGLQQNAARIYACSHLRTLASLTFLSAAVSTIAAFQFRSAATASIHATDDLAAFFGVFNSCAGLMSLAAQASRGAFSSDSVREPT